MNRRNSFELQLPNETSPESVSRDQPRSSGLICTMAESASRSRLTQRSASGACPERPPK